MGTGTAISIWSLVSGISLIIFGFMLTLTIIGAIIGIPMIIIGLGIIGVGATTGATVGAGSMAYKAHRASKENKQKDIRFKTDIHSRGYCSNCGNKIKNKDKFCDSCGEEL